MLRAIAIRSTPQGGADPHAQQISGTAVLQHDERHLRRKAIKLTNGTRVMVDLPEPVVLTSGDQLVLDNGDVIAIAAADEPLYKVTAHDQSHLVQLAWHIGNRHLPAAVTNSEILILRDHVIKAMLIRLGAAVDEITAPFNPIRGAYAGHGSGHHQHDHHHGDHPHHHPD